MKVKYCSFIVVISAIILNFNFTNALAEDISCRKEIDLCSGSGANPCRCDLATSVSINGPTTLVDGATYLASGGRPPYQYEISSGTIDAETGVISEITQGTQSITVTAIDACSQEATMSVQTDDDTPDDDTPFDTSYVGNNCFSASGGVPPYYGQFSCGGTSGLCITSLAGCCGRESMRIYDSGGNEDTYYKTFGTWSNIYSGCADQEDTITGNCIPSYPYTDCNWTYSSSDTRFIVVDWIPIGLNCEKYKVIQSVKCQ